MFSVLDSLLFSFLSTITFWWRLCFCYCYCYCCYVILSKHVRSASEMSTAVLYENNRWFWARPFVISIIIFVANSLFASAAAYSFFLPSLLLVMSLFLSCCCLKFCFIHHFTRSVCSDFHFHTNAKKFPSYPYHTIPYQSEAQPIDSNVNAERTQAQCALHPIQCNTVCNTVHCMCIFSFKTKLSNHKLPSWFDNEGLFCTVHCYTVTYTEW